MYTLLEEGIKGENKLINAIICTIAHIAIKKISEGALL